MAHNFDGLPFELMTEPIRGIRAFRLSASGRLLSPMFGHEFTSGVNVATCDAPEAMIARAMSVAMGVAIDAPSVHPMANCSHGFYAWHDGSDDYASSEELDDLMIYAQGHPERVEGVVEATGEVLLGTRGFRAEKVEIKALVLPYVDKAPTRLPWWKRAMVAPRRLHSLLSHFLWQHDGWGLGVAIFSFLSAAIGAPFLAGYLASVHGAPPAILVALAVFLTGLYFFTAAMRVPSRRERNQVQLDRVYAKVRERYPDVRIYSSRKAMLRDFPIKDTFELAMSAKKRV